MDIAGLVLAYLAGLATPITAAAWAYMTFASPPRRRPPRQKKGTLP